MLVPPRLQEPQHHFIRTESMATELQVLLETPYASSPPSPPHCCHQPPDCRDRSRHGPGPRLPSLVLTSNHLSLGTLPPNLTQSPAAPAFQIPARGPSSAFCLDVRTPPPPPLPCIPNLCVLTLIETRLSLEDTTPW